MKSFYINNHDSFFVEIDENMYTVTIMLNEFSKKEELLKADLENEFEKKLASNIEVNTGEVTEKTTLDIARKMKKQGIDVSDVENCNGII